MGGEGLVCAWMRADAGAKAAFPGGPKEAHLDVLVQAQLQHRVRHVADQRGVVAWVVRENEGW